MIALLFFVGVGVLLLVGLYFLLRGHPAGSARPGDSALAVVEARNALETLQDSLLAPELISRIFAKEDCDFVTEAAPGQIREMFLRERRRIALLWIVRVRRQIASLLRLHRSEARFHAQLNFAKEVALLADFGVLLLSCRTLQLSIFLRGPYGARPLAGKTVLAAARLCDVTGRSLDFLNAASSGPGDELGETAARGRATGAE
ncbi:MAG: hypothetical protein WAJ92_14910 [Candidatus Acidiferrales bacterium]